MKRTTIVAGAVLLLIAGGGIAGTAAASVGPFGDKDATVLTTVDPNVAQFHPQAMAAGSALEAYLQTEPDTNAGVYGEDPNVALTVRLLPGVNPDAGLQDAVAVAEGAGIKVTYGVAQYSLTDLNAATSPACHEPGVKACRPNMKNDQLDVIVDSKSTSQAEVDALQAQYGPGANFIRENYEPIRPASRNLELPAAAQPA